MVEEQEALKIQPGDNPGLGLVSALLDGTNFIPWSRSVKLALLSKSKLGFINGEIQKPENNPKELEQWVKADSMVASWIHNSISRNIVESFMYANSSRELWKELENRYGQSNGPLEYQIKIEMASTSQGTMTVSDYYGKLKKLWDELACITHTPICTCGAAKEAAEIRGNDNLMQFLMGLNQSYDHIRSQILIMDPLPDSNRAYAMVLRVEKQQQVNSGQTYTNPNMAMQAFKKTEPIKNFQRKRNPVDKRTQICKHCGKNGHMKEGCFELIGYPDWYKPFLEQKKEGAQTMNRAAVTRTENEKANNAMDERTVSELIRTEFQKLIEGFKSQTYNTNGENYDFSGKYLEHNIDEYILTNAWIIDSGATAHMCNDKSMFDKLKAPNIRNYVQLADGTKHLVKYTGNMKIGNKIMLENVLFVPNMKYNLLSVSRLCDNSPISFKFSKSHCVVQDLKTEDIIAIASIIEKLYVLIPESFDRRHIEGTLNKVCDIGLAASILQPETWHRRLGHLSYDVLVKTGLVNNNEKVNFPCDICPQAKQQRIPFKLSNSHSKACFDLVHMDLWGPYNEPSISNCSYMLTIVDDYSRCTWTYFMHQKSQTFSLIKEFHKMVLTQFEKRIKTVRTDNGLEFINEQCQTFFKEEGIIHQTTCTYTPQQNGVVERKHKHLLQVARSLIFQANLPKLFWIEAILTSTYIINRLPTSVLEWKTPYETLFNKPVNYSHFRTFGCLCFATNILPHKSKFDSRATKCIFLGYALNQKGYKLYDLNKKVVFVSRDVVFKEDIFPYTDQHNDPLFSYTPVVIPESDTVVIRETNENTAPTPDIPDVEPESNEHTDEHIAENTGLRRSNRQTFKPAKLQDYVCSYSEKDGDMLTAELKGEMNACLISTDNLPQEPKTYAEAIQKREWIDAMNVEIRALEDNKTWIITELPKDKKAIGSKWIYKLKLKSDGSIERYKARLVAKGYNQVEGVDYIDIFSPVAKAVTIRIFLAIACKQNWFIHQLDINNAFLHGYIEEEIYMLPPQGYQVPKGHVCKLKRSIYGLKQSSRQWNMEFTKQLEKLGFVQSKVDHCLFTITAETGFFCLLVYVDDVLIAGPCEKTISGFKTQLHNLFTIKNLGKARFFLGLEICRSDTGMIITQSKYLKDILTDTGMIQSKSTNTPLPAGLKLNAGSEEQLQKPETYRRLLGRLLYLGFTRPDICHATQQLSQYMQQPCKDHWDAALHLVRYLKGTANRGLHFNSTDCFNLEAYCDADWATCKETRRSLTGYCIFLGKSLVSWKTKKQTTVSRSSAEAEYRSMGSTTCELLWIHSLLRDLKINVPTPIPFYCDNQAALYITANPVFHERTKHIEIDCHLVRDKYKEGFIDPRHIASKNQPADIFTKILPGPKFMFLASKLNLINVHPSST
ncbi:UNVERIFIED_CONTAM: Retrovirus-related Pol polyprotein from transposon RE1 [Sesamum indicum]